MIKKLFAVLAIIALCSCSDSTKEATAVASDFLNSYFATDYQTAAACCTEELSKSLMEAVEDYYAMEEFAKKEVQDISSQVTTTITSVQAVGKDTVIVNYDVNMPEPPTPIQNSLTITKVEDSWRIAEL